MAIEKYKALYDLSNNLLQSEHDRFTRTDEKAVRYLSVVTLLVGVEGTLGDKLLKGFIPPNTILQWLLLNTTIFLFLMLVATWFVIFRTLRIHALRSPPLNDEMIAFFNDNTEINIYYHLASANAVAWQENRQVTDKKCKALYYAYQMILGTVCLFIAFACLYFVQAWIKP